MERLRPSFRRALRSSEAANSARAASSGMGGGSVRAPFTRFSKRILCMPLSLEVVARVGAVEGLIAEREVGDDVAFDRGLQYRPLEPGWIAQMAARDLTVCTEAQPNEN